MVSILGKKKEREGEKKEKREKDKSHYRAHIIIELLEAPIISCHC